MRRQVVLLAVMCSALVMGCTAPATTGGLPLKTLGDVPLDGGASRFDYQSIDPGSGQLFIAHLGASLVTVYDLRLGKVIKDIPNIANVHGVLAVPSLHRVYASATGVNQVDVIDEGSLSVLTRIPVGEYPDGLAYDPDTKQLFVSDETGGTVSVVDTQTDRFIQDIEVGGEVGNTQYDPADKLIYSTAQTRNQLVVIDPRQEKVTARYNLPDCNGPHGFIIDPATQYALVTCEGNARLVMFDLTGKKIIATDSVGETPDVVALDQGLHRLYVASESGTMTVFEVRQGSVTKLGQQLLASSAHSVSVDMATHRVYVPLENVDGRPVLRIQAPTS